MTVPNSDLNGPKLRSKTVTLDGPKLGSTTVLLDCLKLQPSTVILDTSIRRWSKFTDRCRTFGWVKKRSNFTVHNRNFGPSKITVHNRNFGLSKITVRNCNFGRSKIMFHIRSFGRSKITFHNRNFGRSKITSHRWSIGPPSKWTIQIYVSEVVHWTIVQMDGPKLRLSGGPLDHRPFGRLSFVNLDGPNYAIWTKEPSSVFTMELLAISSMSEVRTEHTVCFGAPWRHTKGFWPGK